MLPDKETFRREIFLHHPKFIAKPRIIMAIIESNNGADTAFKRAVAGLRGRRKIWLLA
jgi:hypothetical protein